MKMKKLNDKTRYLLGLSGQNILYALVTSSFAYFMQFTILIPAAWLGVILSVGRIFDAVKEPFVGLYINKSQWPIAKFLRVLPLPTAVLTVLCFTSKIYAPENGNLQNAFIIGYCFVIFLLWEMVFSFGDIPMVSLPNVLTQDEDERTKLFTLRNVGGMVCSICCLLVQPLVFALSAKMGGTGTDERNSFFIVALVFSAIGFVFYNATVSKEKNTLIRPKEENTKQAYKYIFKNPLLMRITVSAILVSMTSLQGVVLPALVNYYFSSKNAGLTLLYTFLLGTGSFMGQLFSVFFVPKISKKMGNAKGFVFCNFIAAFPNFCIFMLYLGNKTTMDSPLIFALMYLCLLITGVFWGFSFSLRTLVIDDALELEYKTTGVKPTALFFSFVTGLTKINAGIASFIASLGYVLIGFTSTQTAALNEYIAGGLVPKESGEYTSLFTMLFFMFSVLPAISSLLSCIPFMQKRTAQKDG